MQLDLSTHFAPLSVCRDESSATVIIDEMDVNLISGTSSNGPALSVAIKNAQQEVISPQGLLICSTGSRHACILTRSFQSLYFHDDASSVLHDMAPLYTVV